MTSPARTASTVNNICCSKIFWTVNGILKDGKIREKGEILFTCYVFQAEVKSGLMKTKINQASNIFTETIICLESDE